jgi:hypothetical protein
VQTPATRTLASLSTAAGASVVTRFTALLIQAAQNEKPPGLDGFVASFPGGPLSPAYPGSARLSQAFVCGKSSRGHLVCQLCRHAK